MPGIYIYNDRVDIWCVSCDELGSCISASPPVDAGIDSKVSWPGRTLLFKLDQSYHF